MRTLCACLLFSGLACSQSLPLEGIAHIGFRVSDLEKSRDYYTRLLGYQETFAYQDNSGRTTLAFIKINDQQYLELSPGLPPEEKIRFTHVAFETPDLEALRRLLESRGLAPPAPAKGRDGNLAFSLRDPDNQRIEFVQYLEGSLHNKARGQFMDDRRVSDHLQHIGVTVPPQTDSYWNGEAGPGDSYADPMSGGPENAWTSRNTTFMTWNILHFARILKDAGGVPAYGNSTYDWDLSMPDHPNPEYRAPSEPSSTP